jgi:hypothetical protein
MRRFYFSRLPFLYIHQWLCENYIGRQKEVNKYYKQYTSYPGARI